LIIKRTAGVGWGTKKWRGGGFSTPQTNSNLRD
jgi:hypothetical protein